MTYDRTTVCDALKAHVKAKYGMQKTAAKALSISRTDMCNILQGKRPPCGSILADAGLIKRVVYEPRGQ